MDGSARGRLPLQQWVCGAGAPRRGHGGKFLFILFEAAPRAVADEFRRPRTSSNTSVAHIWAYCISLIHISSREKTGQMFSESAATGVRLRERGEAGGAEGAERQSPNRGDNRGTRGIRGKKSGQARDSACSACSAVPSSRETSSQPASKSDCCSAKGGSVLRILRFFAAGSPSPPRPGQERRTLPGPRRCRALADDQAGARVE